MAKKKRRGSTPPGVDPNEVRRQKLEARREAKAAALREAEKREQRERLIRRVAMLALVGVAVWFVFLRGGTPKEILSHPINDFSTAGANEHTDGAVSYTMTPPVSGQHAGAPAPCGIHGTQIQNELMVHTLEHGAIGLLYDPALEADSIAALEGIVGGYDDHVFSAPFEQMDSPIVIVAWAHSMPLDSVDQAAIQEFIDVFKSGGDAPEPANECPNSENSPFQPGAPDDGATPTEETPVPEATATDN